MMIDSRVWDFFRKSMTELVENVLVKEEDPADETSNDIKEEIMGPKPTVDAKPVGLQLTYQLEQTIHDRPIKPDVLDTIRSMWQFSAICQFFMLFQDQVGVEFFDTNELEELFAYPNEEDWIVEVQVRMFRVGTKNRFIMPDTWLQYMEREFEKQQIYPECWNSISQMKYEEIPLKTRIIMLHIICEMQLDRQDTLKIVAETAENQAAAWRVEPIGHDSKGNTYYIFDGFLDSSDSRLYSESKSKKDPIWKCCCITKNDWLAFTEQFKDSNSTNDKKLYKYFTNSLLPLVLKDLEALEHQREEKKERERQIQQELEEEERKKLEEERAEEERKALEMLIAAESRMESRRGIQTRRSAREPSRGPLTEEEVRQDRLQARELRRLQRESRIFAEYQSETNSNSANQSTSEGKVDEEEEYIDQSRNRTKAKKRKIPKKPPARKRRRYDSEEEDFNSDEETEEDDYSIESDTPPQVESPKEEEKEWWFSCVCGKEGQNYDGI
jgi:hypothetical protein